MSKNLFSINILPKSIIINTINKNFFIINILKKKIRVRLKFLNKTKKKTILITSVPAIINFFINYNKSIQYNISIYNNISKKVIFLLKKKVKWNFIKFKYHGKGYKIKKFNKLGKLTFRLGKSHWTKVIYNKYLLLVRRVKKNRYCCISIKNKMFINFKSLLQNIKGANKYTKRGVRLTRYLFKKRFGKISQASSVYK